MCPASPDGNAAPTFLSSCRKKSRRRSGGKERRFRAKPAPMAPFCAKRLVAVASAVQTCKPVPGAPHAGETEIARRRMPNCRLAFGVVNEWNCFSFRSPSGGVVQNRGPAGPLVWPFQGGVGETGEAPPVADEASLFRGSGAIPGPKEAGNRNAATVLKFGIPRVSPRPRGTGLG